jgi:hypothetical protein
MQWNKTFPQFQPSTVIQTNDEGYELFGVDSSFTPTLIKMNSQGNIQWIANDSNLQQQIGAASFQINHDAKDGSSQTSDGGYAKWTLGSIIKTDSHGNTEWIENFTYPSDNYNGISPLSFFSLIGTSDGSLAALGVGDYYRSTYKGTIYLIKTEPFLPAPSPTKLQNPLPAPYSLEMTVLVISILIIIAIALLLFRRHRKTRSQNKPNV